MRRRCMAIEGKLPFACMLLKRAVWPKRHLTLGLSSRESQAPKCWYYHPGIATFRVLMDLLHNKETISWLFQFLFCSLSLAAIVPLELWFRCLPIRAAGERASALNWHCAIESSRSRELARRQTNFVHVIWASVDCVTTGGLTGHAASSPDNSVWRTLSSTWLHCARKLFGTHHRLMAAN